MLASHHWSTARFTAEADRYTRALNAERAAARRAHRALPRRARLLRDMLVALDRLRAAAKVTPREAERMGLSKYERDTARWLKQYHRLLGALRRLDAEDE
jgi:hypothetical protein